MGWVWDGLWIWATHATWWLVQAFLTVRTGLLWGGSGLIAHCHQYGLGLMPRVRFGEDRPSGGLGDRKERDNKIKLNTSWEIKSTGMEKHSDNHYCTSVIPIFQPGVKQDSCNIDCDDTALLHSAAFSTYKKLFHIHISYTWNISMASIFRSC